MPATAIVDLLNHPPATESIVQVQGWLRSRRDSKAGVSFLVVHDGSCLATLQVVVPDTLPNYQQVKQLTAGAAVKVTGQWVESQGKGQRFEILAQQLQVVGTIDDPESYPIAKKRHSFDYLRTVAHLRPRTNTFAAISRLRSCMAHAIHDYFYQRHFHWVNTPIITASDCEGAGDMFRVSSLDWHNLPRDPQGRVDASADFFGKEAFLTVSGQLNVEAYCLALSRVYTFGPTFRAENSHTSRHLAEFWMVEPEIAFADLQDDIDLAEDFLRYLCQRALEECEDELAFFDRFVDQGCLQRVRQMSEAVFARMEYSEAVRLLQGSRQTFEYPVQWGADLQSEHERYLCEQHVNGPLVLMNYPAEIKAFYMRLNEDGKTVAAMDVLAPGIGEIIGGSQREERLDILDQRMAALQLGQDLEWYRDLRRYGSVPHAGFGLGFERLLVYLTGMENIRDVIPFPRVPNNAAF